MGDTQAALSRSLKSGTGDTWLYQYDVRGNLVRVDLPNGDVIEYLVDGRDRRVGKLVNGSLVRQWLWRDQLSIAAELDGAGNLVSRFVYGTRATTPEFVLMGGNTYRVIADHLGSVRALVNVDDATDVPVELDYDVFGEVSGEGVGVVPRAFAGGMVDVDTGLVRFGARDYDPVVGRWVSKDPIGFGGGQTNIYSYVGNDPINFVDRQGRRAAAAGDPTIFPCASPWECLFDFLEWFIFENEPREDENEPCAANHDRGEHCRTPGPEPEPEPGPNMCVAPPPEPNECRASSCF